MQRRNQKGGKRKQKTKVKIARNFFTACLKEGKDWEFGVLVKACGTQWVRMRSEVRAKATSRRFSGAHARGLARSQGLRSKERAAGVRGGWYLGVDESPVKVTWGKARDERMIPGALLTPGGSWWPLRASFPDPAAQGRHEASRPPFSASAPVRAGPCLGLRVGGGDGVEPELGGACGHGPTPKAFVAHDPDLMV